MTTNETDWLSAIKAERERVEAMSDDERREYAKSKSWLNFRASLLNCSASGQPWSKELEADSATIFEWAIWGALLRLGPAWLAVQ